MRLSRLVSVGLAVFSLGTAVVLTTALTKSLRDYHQTATAADAARVQTAWVDAQVALSLERGLTQIILEDERETPDIVKNRLRDQRSRSDMLLARARELAMAPSLEADSGSFLAQSAALQQRLGDTRKNIDRFLGLNGLRRSRSLNKALVSQLIRIVDDTLVVRETLRAFDAPISGRSATLIAMQERAEEVREHAGRARTPVAVALLQPDHLRRDRGMEIDTNLLRANRSWERFMVMADEAELPDHVSSAIEDAGERFYRSYGQTLQVFRFLWQASPSMLEGREAEHFERFFLESSHALASIETVTAAVGDEIIEYWVERSRNAKLSLMFYAACVVALAGYMIAFFYFANAFLVRRIEKATKVLSAVAEGDLNASADPRPTDLEEIASLHGALEQFRESLKKARDAEIEARTDALTGLPNRRDLDDLLTGQRGTPLGTNDVFGFLDLDDFKPINDMFGHETGDAVLRVTADRLSNSADGSDEVWRLGGDEFGIVWRDMADESAVRDRAKRLLDALSEPIRHKGKDIIVAGSIGLARADCDALNPQEIVSQADFAMFIAKHRPTDKFELASPKAGSRSSNISRRREILSALTNEEFEPFFQPQFSLTSGQLEGFEVLARWRRPNGEILTPGQFMSLVEHQQLQSRVDIFMLEKALSHISDWTARFSAVPKVSVNMSEETLASDESREHILDLFVQHADLLDYLTVEVTEDALVDRSATAIRQTLEAFAKTGVDLSMDDFGTGYGSFRHLKEYRFDEVKIDQSFVASMNSEKTSQVIIEGFIAIAKGLGARVVAEGVETVEQLDQLTALGCDIGQGYHFGRPEPVDSAVELLSQIERRNALRVV